MFVYFKGSPITIIEKRTPFSFSSIIQKDNSLIVKVSSCVSIQDMPSFTQSKISQWLKAQARTYFEACVMEQCSKYSIEYNQIRVKDTKSRWGSCSARKNLNFNWRLIMAPESILEYIVIHETAHLTELNHSQKFWKIVSDRCPDYKTRQNWLNINGHRLLNNVFFEKVT